MSGHGANDREAAVRNRWHMVVLAAVSWLPVLASRPGFVVADTKAFLYLNPGRLLADAPEVSDCVGAQVAALTPRQRAPSSRPTNAWWPSRLAAGSWGGSLCAKMH